MSNRQFVNVVLVGPCRVTIRGEATALVDFNEPLTVSGEQVLEVTRQANLSVDGQVIAIFAGQGAFVADKPTRVRVVTAAGGACVNMTAPGECHVGGKGVIFAEGIESLRVDDEQSVIALDCQYTSVHDQAKLAAIGCTRVESYGKSRLDAFGVASLLVVESSHLTARDCPEVLLDQGRDGVQPTVEHLSNCGTPVAMEFDPIAHTEELGYHETYVPVEGQPGAEHIRSDEEPEALADAEAAVPDGAPVEVRQPVRQPD